jgi:hypothetical protein
MTRRRVACALALLVCTVTVAFASSVEQPTDMAPFRYAAPGASPIVIDDRATDAEIADRLAQRFDGLNGVLVGVRPVRANEVAQWGSDAVGKTWLDITVRAEGDGRGPEATRRGGRRSPWPVRSGMPCHGQDDEKPSVLPSRWCQRQVRP